MGRKGEVHRGDAQRAAQPVAVDHGLGQAVAVAQEQRRPLHVPGLHQRADIGRADGNALQLHLGDDVAAQPQLPALLLQKPGIALILVAEVVVVARHQMHGPMALYQQLRDKILPQHGHHGLVKGGQDHLLNAIDAPGQIGPILRGVDEGHRYAGDYLLRRLRPGEHRRADAPAPGLFHGAAQQGAVAQMDPVEKAQSNDF